MTNPLKGSARLNHIPVSSVRQLSGYLDDVKKRGTKVYHLNIGDPDIKTPECMIDALRHWDKNPIGYTNSKGNAEMLEAMASYYHRCGYDFLKPKDMIITVGGSEAISMVLVSIADVGDEVLVFEPFYSNYAACASIAGVKLVGVPTDIEKGFHLPEAEVIETYITSKTKGILFCTPGNPTGTVYTHDELKMLVDLARNHKLFLVSDEPYREYIFGGKKHVSLFSFMQELPEQTIVIDSLSKRYSLCGARVGIFTTLNTMLVAGAIKIAQARLSGDMLGQVVGAKMNDVPDTYIAAVQKEYQVRRDVVYSGLTQIAGVTTYLPEGAFYLMASLPVKDGFDFCRWLLTEYTSDNETVMLAPGAGFYATPGRGQSEVRIAYVLKAEDLRRSIEILKKGLEAYPGAKPVSVRLAAPSLRGTPSRRAPLPT